MEWKMTERREVEMTGRILVLAEGPSIYVTENLHSTGDPGLMGGSVPTQGSKTRFEANNGRLPINI